MEHFWQEIVGWSDEGLRQVYKMAVEHFDSGYFLELGTANGQSAAFMGVEIVNSGKDIRFATVDKFEDNGQYKRAYEALYQIGPDAIPVYWDDYNNGLPLVVDEFYNFIFHDGSHEYEDLLTELPLCWSKLAPGGWFGGHDYGREDGSYPGVTRAVNEFAASLGLPVEKIGICFLIRKPL